MSTSGRRIRGSGLRLAVGAGLAALLSLSMTGVALASATPAATRPGAAAPRPAATGRTDVYTRDNVGDTGVEPNPSGLPFWASPDIKVCQTAYGCAADQPLSVGATDYVFVNLNNNGPYGSGVGTGTLYVYYTLLGGAAQWPTDWTTIGAVGVSVYPGVTTVTVPWVNVPDDGPSPGAHFCLLTRWVSGTDPMVWEGPNTQANTIANNNLSWHNVAPIGVTVGTTTGAPFALGNVLATPARNDLVFTEPGKGFETAGGIVVVDLGQDLFERWKAAGGQGVGIKPIGGTRIQLVEPARARIVGLTVDPGKRPQIQLSFTATTKAAGQFTLDVTQVGPGDDGGKPADIGGVEYDLTVNGQ
jgi:hypothetical protein